MVHQDLAERATRQRALGSYLGAMLSLSSPASFLDVSRHSPACAARLINACPAETSAVRSKMQKERAHGWRGGPPQPGLRRRFVWVLAHRCSKWATKAEAEGGR